MNLKLRYVFALVMALQLATAQESRLPLAKAGCRSYKGRLYCFGLTGAAQHPAFCIYRLDAKLKKLDSLVLPPFKAPLDNYLLLYADTLHDHLNVYIQQKESRTVSILRFNSDLKLLASINDVEVARLNSSAMFGPGAYYYRNSVYAVKAQSDTSGKQFYVNRYELKSEQANFEYELKWQFPFERRYIHDVHVFYANQAYLLAFVSVDGGLKKGQWVLKINAGTGKLIKGTKLNDKTDLSHFLFGAYRLDESTKSLQLLGQKFTQAQFDPALGKLNIGNLPALSMYYVEIDSLDEVSSRQEFKIPITEPKTGMAKTSPAWLLKITELRRHNSGGLTFGADIYKSRNEALCFYYAGSNRFNLLVQDEILVPEKNGIAAHPQVEQFYTSADKLDLNGKLCIDTLSQFGKIVYKEPTLPVKLLFKTDEFNNPFWVLSKSNLKKNSISYALLGPVKKAYELKVLEEPAKETNPSLLQLSGNSFVISSQSGAELILHYYSW